MLVYKVFILKIFIDNEIYMLLLKKISFIILFFMTTETTLIFDFSTAESVEEWQVVNDGVMGGLSKSEIEMTNNGHAKFSGHVSLANNGGFASVRHTTKVKIEPEQEQIVLRLKGDGKVYQFRLKSDLHQPESYVKEFQTNGEWQTVKIKLNEFSPQFRGRKLNMPNFNFDKIEEIRFLIANKKEEDFELIIESIAIK